MANIIRCVLPNGVHRFKPFTVKDYRDFILTRVDLDNHSIDDQHKIVDELTQEYFKDLPLIERHYVFLKTFLGSIGKSKIPVIMTCPICGADNQTMFHLTQNDLLCPEQNLGDVILKFNYPDKEYSDLAFMVMDCIKSVIQENNEYEWSELDDSTKDAIISLIDMTTLEEIIKKLNPIHFVLRSKCCNTVHTLDFKNLLSIFKVLISPDEIFTFYQINHVLQKHDYDLNSIMNMLPVERGYALSMVNKDLSK